LHELAVHVVLLKGGHAPLHRLPNQPLPELWVGSVPLGAPIRRRG
jgi:hypothetical protein